MDERIFQIIIALIPILGSIITAFILPALTKLIKSKVSAEDLQRCKNVIGYAVKCAEMLWTETGHGSDKKQYVVDFIDGWLNDEKIIMSTEQINVLVEACVQELNAAKTND